MKRFNYLIAIMLVFVTLSVYGQDKTAEAKGQEIAAEADKRDSGFKDSQSIMKMVLRNRHGDESVREIRSKILEVDDDGDKTLVVFDKPKDVKGTAFLSFTHKTGADDQWLYLPALKRVKRIASNNKSGPFMGSEFAFEDISSQEVEKYTYKYIGDEKFDGQDCYMVERDPVDPKSGYKRQIAWYDKAEYRIQKIDFYDRKDSKMKTLTYSGYKQYLDKYWRSDKMMMVNHQTGKSTDLVWKDYKFKNGFKERDFDKASLKRIR